MKYHAKEGGMTKMLHTNPMAFVLLSLAITGVVMLTFLLLFGENFYSGRGLWMSRWVAGTLAQYALAFGLAALLEEKDGMMTGRDALYFLTALTLVSPGTIAQIIIVASYFSPSA